MFQPECVCLSFCPLPAVFVGNKIVVGHLSITTRQRARARRMGVADLYNACSDWSTVKE